MNGPAPQPGDVISHHEMCGIERTSLQRGMNYRIGGRQSVFLMSTRPNAPYQDEVLDGGRTLIYEGHDEKKSSKVKDPKLIAQPLTHPSGRLTQNGLFFQAANERGHTDNFERVRVYEKIKSGIWVFNGTFALREADVIESGGREVCRFRLELIDEDVDFSPDPELVHTRMIPSAVKQEVWRRDAGCCRECGSKENLHFDHVIPFSKGGSSLTAENIQLLCANHNLAKSARII